MKVNKIDPSQEKEQNLLKDINLESFSEEPEQKNQIPNIWETHPSYRDTHPKRLFVKLITLVIGLFFFFSLTLLIVSTLLAAFFMTSLIAVFFLFAFRDIFFRFQNSPISKFKTLNLFDPFENIQFWIWKDDLATLLITNEKDLSTIATRIFELRILPENVNPTLSRFLRELTRYGLSVTYQIIHKPVIRFPEKGGGIKKNKKVVKYEDNDSFKNKLNYNELGSSQVSIYFSVYSVSRGIITKRKLNSLLETIKTDSDKLNSLFKSNFSHTLITLLEKRDLVNAIRTVFLGGKIELVQKDHNNFKLKKINPQFLFKLAFVVFISVYTSILLFIISFPWYWIAIIDAILIILVLSLLWKEVFFFFTNRFLERIERVREIDPFSRIQFFRVKEARDLIFLYVDNLLLVGLKSFNLAKVSSVYLANSGELFRKLSGEGIPFAYTLHTSPTSLELFLRECKEELNETAEKQVRRILGDTIFYSSRKQNFSPEETFRGAKNLEEKEDKFNEWLQIRSGIWRTSLTLSCFSYKFTSSLIEKNFLEIKNELLSKSKIIFNDYKGSFIYHTLVPLEKNELISGFLTETLKNNIYRADGTHLTYVYIQGKSLTELIKISADLKKGVETVIAAEFVSPTHLENYITIGKTINTEFLREESPLGLKLEQISKLLITNGNSEQRELLSLKIVSKLIMKGVPSIIFDFSGNCTKLVKLFENTRFANEFLCFKLGSSFNINLLDSEIKYDSNNAAYLNYFYDAYALAFKESRKNVDSLKEIVSTNQQHSLSSITFDLQMMQKWEKGTQYGDIYNFFNDFNQQSVIFSDKVYEFEGKVTPVDFLKDNRVIIIDVSILTDLEQKVFASFVLLSKIIHYINNFSEYYPKIVVLPFVDLFFDSNYLDSTFGKHINYGKVNKFLDPLVQNGFGVVLLANEIRYLHPNLFNYINNIITFKAIDNRDIAILRNEMNLQEFKKVYTNKRNNTYQLEYLANMKRNEVIIKRNDIDQPFPGRIYFNALYETSMANYYEIIDYMKCQGYNLKLTEEKIMDYAKKTIFELDLGIYSEFKEEIKNCLAGIKPIEKIALSKDQIKKALDEFVITKASKKTKDKKQLRDIRDSIFSLLVKHGYLETTSRKNAAGSEEMRVCYIVGKKYDQAKNDEFEPKKSEPIKDASIEPISVESNRNIGLDTIFQEKTNENTEDNIEEDIDDTNKETTKNNTNINSPINLEEQIPKKSALESVYNEKVKELYYSILQIYKCIEKNQLSKAIERIKDLVVFIDFFQENGKTNGDIAILKQRINEINASDVKDPIITRKIADIYILFRDFYYSIQNHNNRNSQKAEQMI